ncbi:MAG: SpoIID/LytB domain-containing protein [Phycisphaerales bacterium]
MALRMSLRKALTLAARQPRLNAALVAAVVALGAGWGLWSCQSTPGGGAPVRAEAPPIPATEPDVRIRIKAAVASVKLTGPEQFLIRAGVGESATLKAPVTITATAGGCRIVDASGSERAVASVPWVEIESIAKGSAAAARIKVDGVAYPGRLRIIPRTAPLADAEPEEAPPGPALASSDPAAALLALQAPSRPKWPAARAAPAAPAAKMDLIEVVPIEAYLTGVIIAEMPSHWPLGAFHVQAVCARTYALHERARSIQNGKAWDLEAGELDQAYNGGPEIPNAAKAVAETRGIVLTWNGGLLRSYYSSTCGGRTAGAASVWPTGPGFEFNLAAPIQPSPRETTCKDSPIHRWSLTRDRAELSKQLREWGRTNGHPIGKMALIEGVETVQTNPVGRPTRYVVTDDKGATFPIAAELLRVACNYGVAGVKPITRETRVRSGDLEMDVTPSGVVIRGRGFGHGVGMCQYCARAMAERGDPWQEAVLRFYPGAKLERAY